MSLSLNLVRIICGSCVLNLVAIVCLEVCSKLRLSGGWLGGCLVYMKNNAILSEDWIGFSDRSSVAIKKIKKENCKG